MHEPDVLGKEIGLEQQKGHRGVQEQSWCGDPQVGRAGGELALLSHETGV